MHQPLLVSKLLFLSVAAVLLQFAPHRFWIAGAISLLLLLAVYPLIRRRFPNPSVLFCFPLLFCMIDLRVRSLRLPDPAPLVAPVGTIDYENSVIASGTVERRLGASLYRVRFESMRKEQKEKRVFKTVRSPKTPRSRRWRKPRYRRHATRWVASGETRAIAIPVALRIRGGDFDEGCTLRIRLYGRGVIRGLGGAPFDAYLERNGAAGYGSISKRYHLLSSDCASISFRARIRKRIRTLLVNARFSDDTLDVTLGILFGKTSYMNKGLKEEARRLGILHLFAASGLHLGLLYLCFYFPVRLLFGKMHPASLFIPLPFCFAYLLFLEFPVSLSRAFLFLALHAMKSVIHRHLPTSHYLVNTALALLIVSPYALVSLSALLSFAAVGGILYFYESYRTLFRARSKAAKFVINAYCMSLSASLLTAPLLCFAFSGHSYGSTFINALVVPVASVLLPLLYAGVMIGLLPGLSVLANLILSIGKIGMEGFLQALHRMEPFALYCDYKGSFPIPLLFLSFQIAMLLLYRRRLDPKFAADRKQKERLRRALIVSIALASFPGYPISVWLTGVS